MRELASGSAPPAHRPVVSVEELRRAWRAVEAGQFRAGPRTQSGGAEPAVATPSEEEDARHQRWIPAAGEVPVVILGCHGSAGTSTLALAVVSLGARTVPTRVVECRGGSAAGLSAASTAELGTDPSGWVQGRRAHDSGDSAELLVERPADDPCSAAEVPIPSPPRKAQGSSLTVLDASWEPKQLLRDPGWLGAVTRGTAPVVVVAAASLPGLVKLEATLELLAGEAAAADRGDVVVLTLRTPRLPRSLRAAAGPRTRRAWEAGRVIEIPHDRRLSIAGVDSAPLPGSLLAGAQKVLDLAIARRLDPLTSPGEQ